VQAAADHYERSGLGVVAVRSSATAEDSADFSSAGQYSTCLNVAGKQAVKQAVFQCVRSLENETAQHYSQYFSGAKSAAMNVIVQEMIDADVAGICFTQHPNDTDSLLIEAVRGLGETLVDGTAQARTYSVSKHAMEADGDDMLTAQIICTIAQQANAASAALGYPLDTEWAVKDGKLYWLQARPITVTEEIDAFELDTKSIAPDSVLTTCNVGEMLPGAVTPLSLSTSVASIDFGMRKMIVKSGAAKSYDAVPKESCITHVGGHLFINLTSLYVMGDAIVGATREGVELSICDRTLDDLPKPPVKSVSKLARINNARKYFSILFRVKGACRKLDKMSRRLSIADDGTPEALINEIGQKLWWLDEAFWLHYIASAQSGSMSSALLLILLAEGMDSEESKAMLAGVLEDIDGIESVDILRSLRSIARALIEENPDVKDYDAAQLEAYLSTCIGASKQALNAFLERHGHRAIREAEMRSRSWHMDRASLCSYLRSVISSGGAEVSKVRSAEKNIEALLKEKKGLMRILIKYIIGQARQGVVNREYTKSRSIKVLDVFKSAYWRLADMLEEMGILPEGDLMFFLQHNEIVELITKDDRALVKKAIARRRVLAEQATFAFDEVCVGKPEPISAALSSVDSGELCGSSISRGRATGRARVVRSVADAEQLEAGEIMVAAFTDIGWSPYYCLLGALVTEVGSALSHGAVVAREYALPLVSNVAAATRLIRTGDMLCVDGSAGRVTILAQKKEECR
jgi:pyruvate,water dikinase